MLPAWRWLLPLQLLLLPLRGTAGELRPIVIMHGLGVNHNSVSYVQKWIENALPGVYVRNAEVGTLDAQISNSFWSLLSQLSGFQQMFETNAAAANSLMLSMNHQVQELCTLIRSDPHLSQGFNVIGHSQGGLLARGYVQRCNDPPVHNFISVASPHGGVFGIPIAREGNFEQALMTAVDHFVTSQLYSQQFQLQLSFAQYWKDPFNYTGFLQGNSFLADLNNEVQQPHSATYKANIMKLANMVLIGKSQDTIVVPKESATFGFYAENRTDTVIPLRDSSLYKEDRLGLRYLDSHKRLHDTWTAGNHSDINEETFAVMLPFLNNSIESVVEQGDAAHNGAGNSSSTGRSTLLNMWQTWFLNTMQHGSASFSNALQAK